VVPAKKFLKTGGVPVNKFLKARGVPANNLFHISDFQFLGYFKNVTV
jgi:hypothetical protein